MNEVPSIFNTEHPNSITTDNAQLRWCVQRCHRCKSIFTVQILKDDIPSAYKCLSCDNHYLYSKQDLREMHLI